MRSRGLALILVVGVLAVLAILGSAFAILSRLERKSALQRVWATQALLLARSAIEDAFARLEMDQDSLYGGEDHDDSGTLNLIEVGNNAVYRPLKLDVESCPVVHALRPSFFTRDLPTNPTLPRTHYVGSRQRGSSGAFRDGQVYALKVLTGGGFYVNGGDPSQDWMLSTCYYNTVLRRLFGTLAEALDREDGANDGAPVNQTDGEALIDFRPQTPRGWESYEQIRDMALGGSRDKLEALQPYLSLRAWVDKKVLAPQPSIIVGPAPGHGFERTVGGRVVGRAPVDFAWARHRRPALIALFNLRDLKTNAPFLDWGQPTDTARQVADAVLTSTSEIRTWGQWSAFCDALTIPLWTTAEQNLQTARTGFAGALSPFTNNVDYDAATDAFQTALWADPAPRIRDILKMHFNPNTDFSLFGADRSLARQYDKTSLDSLRSTELALRSAGGERISAVGRILDSRGHVLASRTLSAERPFRNLLRLTTQAEFVSGSLGSLDLAGDESSWRSYGDTPYITEAFANGHFGQALSPSGRGFSLQTYPEPHVVWTAPGTGKPAWYDGQVRLATVETQDDGGPCFLASWPDAYDATRSNGTPVVQLDTQHPPLRSPVWDTGTPMPSTNRGVMRPDGLYVTAGREPGYAAAGGFPPFRGVISFWFKPVYSQDVVYYNSFSATGFGHLFNNTHSDGTVWNSPTACFQIEFCPVYEKDATSGGPPPAFGFHWENKYGDGYESTFIRQESVSQAPRQAAWSMASSHRWTLLTGAWDMKQSILTAANRLFMNGGGPACTYVYYNGSIDTTNPVDFSAPHYAGAPAAYFHLGGKGNRSVSNQQGKPFDAVFDEFQLYDLDAASVDPAVLAQDRYKEGRYYKPSYYASTAPNPLALTPAWSSRQAGEWFSAPIDLGPGTRILGLSWTQVVPAELQGNSRIAMDLTNAAADDYARDATGAALTGFRLQDAWSVVDRTVRSSFRLHAVFQPMYNVPSATKLNTPILDALALDDVTVAWRPGVAPPCGTWTEGE